ncbi:hypothetical protein BDW62DRAFT_205023 [Aspergillus aurantiobrunneus]
MDLAKLAHDELTRGDNEKINELRKWLFLFNELGSTRVKRVYENIQLFKPLDQASTAAIPQPTIYCDLSRFTEIMGYNANRQLVPAIFNEKINAAIPKDEAYRDCKAGIKTIAYTNHIKRRQDDGTIKEIVEIQICPWYLEAKRASDLPVNLIGGLPERREDGPAYDPSTNWSGVRKPHAHVLAEFMDSILLHEFTHALLRVKGGTKDFAYKWNVCVSDGFQVRGCLNANSFSYFAIGVRLIKKHGIKLSKDGNIVALNAATSKRDLEQFAMKRWTA